MQYVLYDLELLSPFTLILHENEVRTLQYMKGAWRVCNVRSQNDCATWR